MQKPKQGRAEGTAAGCLASASTPDGDLTTHTTSQQWVRPGFGGPALWSAEAALTLALACPGVTQHLGESAPLFPLGGSPLPVYAQPSWQRGW